MPPSLHHPTRGTLLYLLCCCALVGLALLPWRASDALWAAPPSGRQVLENSKAAKQSETQITAISMLLVDKKNKQQTRSIKIWAVQKENDNKTLTRFTKPHKVAGTGFLVLGEGDRAKRWLYLPNMKKTRMIAEGDKNKTFMGTDFTYYDLSPHDLGGSTYDPVVEETVGGTPCYKVTGHPKDLDTSLYGKVVQWVRKDNWVPIHMDFYDKSGQLLKKSRVIDLQDIDGNWTPMKMEMLNVQTRHKTVMTVNKVEYDTEIPDRYFTKSHLARGK